jgi:hypothetical protein
MWWAVAQLDARMHQSEEGGRVTVQDYSEVEVRAMMPDYLTARHVVCGEDIGMWTNSAPDLDDIITAADEHRCGS